MSLATLIGGPSEYLPLHPRPDHELATMSLAAESGAIRIPHAALFSSNPASRAIRALVLGGLNPRIVAELLLDEQRVAVLDILLAGMQDNVDEQIRFAPLAGSLVGQLGSLSVPSASPRFLGVLSCLRVVVAGLRSAVQPCLGAADAQELLQSSHGFFRRFLEAHRTSVDQSEPVEAIVRSAFDVVCDAVILACASIDVAAPGTLGSEREVLDCALCLASLFGVDDDAVSAQVSRALGACIQWLALAASIKAERGEGSKPGGFSAETELTGALKSLHRGVLRELAAAALQMPAASSTPPDQVQAAADGATQRLVAALVLCETLTEWLGGTWLVAASADHDGRNGSGSFLRALAGCIASEAKVRLEDVEFWLVLVDTAAAAAPAPAVALGAEPAQHSGRGMEYGPHDASAALANVQARLTAFPRRRRLQAAVDSYAGHAQVLSSAWRVLGSLVRILATLSDDEPPAEPAQTAASSVRGQVPSSLAGLRAALRPDDLLALRGTLQDAASFALMSAASLWQSDLRMVLESRDPDSPPDDLHQVAVSAAGLDVDSLAPRFAAAATVVTGATRYAMTYLREDPGACEAEWAAALPCLARLDSTLVVSPEAWVARVRCLLDLDATSPAGGSTAPVRSFALKTRAVGGLGSLLSHLTLDILEVLRLKVEVWEGSDALSDFCALPEAPLLVARGLAWLRRCARAFSLAAMAAEALSLDVHWAQPGGGGGSDGTEAAAPEIAQLQKLQADEVADAVAPQLTDSLAAALGVCAAVLDLLKAPPVRRGLTGAAAAASPASPVASAVLDLAAFATRLVRYYAQPASPVQRRWAGLRGARPAALRCARKLLGLASELAVALQDAGQLPPPRQGRPDLQAAVAAAVAVVFER